MIDSFSLTRHPPTLTELDDAYEEALAVFHRQKMKWGFLYGLVTLLLFAAACFLLFVAKGLIGGPGTAAVALSVVIAVTLLLVSGLIGVVVINLIKAPPDSDKNCRQFILVDSKSFAIYSGMLANPRIDPCITAYVQAMQFVGRPRPCFGEFNLLNKVYRVQKNSKTAPHSHF